MKTRVKHEHFNYLLTGYTADVMLPEKPSFIDLLAWIQMFKTIIGLSKLTNFDGFEEQFLTNTIKFKAIYEADDPSKVAFPGEWQEKLDPFEKLLVFKAIRPD